METKRLINGTCPECRGPLSETVSSEGRSELREYKCLVGHAYTARALLEAHCDAQERSLWSAVVALEEAVNLVESIIEEFPPETVERLREQAQKKQKQAQEVRAVLERLEPFQTG